MKYCTDIDEIYRNTSELYLLDNEKLIEIEPTILVLLIY